MEPLEKFFKDLKKKYPKLKGKYLPISRKKGNVQFALKVSAILSLNEDKRGRLYLFKLINPNKPPKFAYFLSIVLASQSSDFLVLLAKILIKNSQILLIQYPLKPEHRRISLLCLNEIVSKEDFFDSQEKLKDIYNLFQNKLNKIAELSK